KALHPRCYLGSGAAAPHCEMPLHQEKGERLAVWQLISLRECFYQHRHFQEVSFSPRCSFLGITPQLSRERPRSGLTSAGAQCYAQPIPLNVGLESCISVPPHDYVPGRPTPNDWLTGCSVIASPRDQNMSTRKLFEIIYTEHLQKLVHDLRKDCDTNPLVTIR